MTVKTKQRFDRKVFTLSLFLNDLGFLFKKSFQLITAPKDKKISKPFTEKIMTIVTAVNGCTYCAWFHAKQSVSCGISKEELRDMLNLQFHSDASDFELPGLLYAQHYAETNRKPDNEMTDKLFEFYGKKTAENILMKIRMIFFGNLYGNTFDAFLSRLKGNKSENSNLIFEFFFFIFSAPLLIPLIPFTKKYRK